MKNARVLPFFAFGFSLLLAQEAFAWKAGSSKDKMTDETTYTLQTSSKGVVWSGKKADLFIDINCDSGKELLTLKHPYLVKEAKVKIRLDKDEPFEIWATASSSAEYLFIKDKWKDDSYDLIKTLFNHKIFVIEYRDLVGSLYQAEFDISNLEKKYNATCPEPKESSPLQKAKSKR